MFPYIQSLPSGIWILGDTAFPCLPGRVERVRKINEGLPANPQRAQFQLLLEQFCGKIRLGAEWGIKDLKGSWLIFKSPLPSDCMYKRKLIWVTVLHLHNFRQRVMKIGQIGNVFELDCEE